MSNRIDLAPAAWVSTYPLLRKITNFLNAWEEKKDEYQEAKAELDAYRSPSRFPFFMRPDIDRRVHRAHELHAICASAVDGKVLIGSDDLRLVQTLDAADIDIAINNARQWVAAEKKRRAEIPLYPVKDKHSRNFVIFSLAVFFGVLAVVGTALRLTGKI